MKAPTIPNPTRPGALRPAHLITDRAKRYRAQANIPTGPKRCVYCGAPGHAKRRLDVEHINGNEADSNPANLVYACRPCNVTKANTFARHGIGVKTRQYNPGIKGCGPGPKKKRGVKSVAEWVWAVMTVRGKNDEGCKAVRKAASLISHTPAYKQSDFARQIWETRHERGTTRTGREAIPF